MNCDLLQRRLLNLERPDRPPAEVQAHLAGCPSCREWQRRLVRLEQRVALLPVPASTAKGAFVARLRACPRTPTTRSPNGAGNRGQRRERALKKLAFATSLAAGLVLFAFIWWALQWSRPERGTPGDLLTQLVQHDVDLAKADTPSNRLKALGAMANDLQAHAEPLCRQEYADDLAELAGWYKQVVAALPLQARGLANGDPEKLARRLEQSGRDTEELARNVPAPCAGSLHDMASAAQDAARRLAGPEAQSQGLRRARVILPQGAPPVCCADVTPVVAAYLVPSIEPGTVFASAARGSSPDVAAEQAQRFRQNRSLLRKLVEEAVCLADLSGDQHALDRASHCNEIAEKFADEMRAAAAEQQGTRIVDLSKFLKSLLQDGVASNLSTARTQVERANVSPGNLQDVRNKTTEFVKDLDRTLQDPQNGLDSGSVSAILAAVHQGQDAVKKASEEGKQP
jgi:hypothetical protein